MSNHMCPQCHKRVFFPDIQAMVYDPICHHSVCQSCAYKNAEQGHAQAHQAALNDKAAREGRLRKA